MTQATTWGVPRNVGEADLSEDAWAARADESLDALLSCHKGSTAPTYAVAGTEWIDDSATPWVKKVYDGTDWLIVALIDASDAQVTLADATGFADSADRTKRVRLDAGNVTASNTRVLTMPDQDVTISAFGASLVDDADADTARRTLITGHAIQALATQNMMLNPHLLVSQENGSNSLSILVPYGADQQIIGAFGGMAALHGRRAASFTGVTSPFPYMYEIDITTADTSLAAGDYTHWAHKFEADQIAPLMMGTSAARGSFFVFHAEADFTCTLAAGLRNHTPNRSFVREFSLTANTPDIVVIEFDGDTSGTWNNVAGNSGGVLDITLAAGSTFQTTAGAWQAGNYIGTSGMTNGVGTVGNTLKFTPIGWFPKAFGLTKTLLEGLSLADYGWLLGRYSDELKRCKRFWEQMSFTAADNLADVLPMAFWETEKYATPSLTLSTFTATPTIVVAGQLPRKMMVQTAAATSISTGVVTGSARF